MSESHVSLSHWGLGSVCVYVCVYVCTSVALLLGGWGKGPVALEFMGRGLT